MAEPRTVVITGASRGLGLASAARLYRDGWRVVAAMRTPDSGLPLLRQAIRDATGASADDDRLIGVQLDLLDEASIAAAAKVIEEEVGAPYAIVHNAGISSAGMVEEADMALWQRMFATSVLGPVALTKALLPSMRAAGEGRIVLVASAAGVRGQPATAPYSAAKGALERWGESMALEIAPFGLGVTILVAGTYDTDIITDAGTTDDRNFGGPYARLHNTMNTRGRFAMRLARAPERFTDGCSKRWPTRSRSGAAVLARTPRCCWPPTGHSRRRGCTTCRDRAGNTQTGFDAGWGVAVDDGAEGDGARRAGHPAAGHTTPGGSRGAQKLSTARGLGAGMEQLFDDLEDFGSFDDAISGDVRDPYTELARLRREEPVQRLETSGALPHEESLPMFIVYRHEDIQQMLRDNETFSSAAVIAAFGPVLGERVMLGMDEPVHGRLRSLVSKAFSQRSLARWQDELVGRVANSLIDNFAPNGKADLVKEFTFDYPSQIIAGLLGLPEKDYPQFQRWSISLLSWLMNPERGLAAAAALCDYFAPILEARRAEPKDDLISALGAAEIDGEKLADEEIFSFLRLLLPAGVETTYRSLGSLLLALLKDPQQLEAIRADRSLLPQAIEEGVRWESPLLTITRVATRDTELGGVAIPAGATVMPMLGSANRQEDRYPDPDTFDIHRQAKANLGWGHGVHVCLGMHLARLEMRTAINLLLDRLPNLRLDPDGDDPHIRGQVFRSPTSVPVLFDPE